MVKKNNITGIVLAGGKSSRMGLDKGLIKMNQQTFIQAVINAMRPLVGDIIIVSNNSDYDQFGYLRINDLIKDSGPVAGLYSGLCFSQSDYNLVLSCDIPFIKTDVLKYLFSAEYTKYDVVQLKSMKKTMPLIAIYHKKCLDSCLTLLRSNEKRLRTLVQQLNTKTIIIDDTLSQYVENINTKAEFKDLGYDIEY
jgi:molybdopterin-guanine dinucleotide biosynthesis protein A